MPAVSDACNVKLYLSIKPSNSWGHCAPLLFFLFLVCLYLRHCIGPHHYFRILHHKCCVFKMLCQVKNCSSAKNFPCLLICSLFCSEPAAILKVEGCWLLLLCNKKDISKKVSFFCPYNKSQRGLMVLWSPLTFNTLTKIVKTFLKISSFMFYTRKKVIKLTESDFSAIFSPNSRIWLCIWTHYSSDLQLLNTI